MKAPGMRVIVCGSRLPLNPLRIEKGLDQFHEQFPIEEVIEGGAPGVDHQAAHWAKSRGIKHTSVPADWDRHGRAAGPIRNALMLKLKPDAVIAFPGGAGTANMVMQAQGADIPVHRRNPNITHHLKTEARWLAMVRDGIKTAEVRRLDRDYQIGDTLLLQEWAPAPPHWGTMAAEVMVTHILRAEDFPGVAPGYGMISFSLSWAGSVDEIAFEAYGDISIKRRGNGP